MTRSQQPSRILATWVLLVLAVSSLLPLRGEWDEGRLAPWRAPVSAGGILDSVEPALPGVPKVSRGWSGTGEGRWGQDLPELSFTLSVVPAISCWTVCQNFSTIAHAKAIAGLGFEAPTLRPRPPPVLSAVL